MTRPWPDDARRRLLDLRRGAGAWGYRPRSTPAVEPSALAGLALLAGPFEPARPAASASGLRLASSQRPDGSLAASPGVPEAGWPTPFALLLWSNLGGFATERSLAVARLLKLEGRTMAQAEGDPLGHDTMLVGWPWVDGTHSWVEPTAAALLALAREGLAGHPRAVEGARLLVDRAIPTGGWNLGNPVVFGTPLRPLPGPTGLALLALASLGVRSGVVGKALAYLRSALGETLAPISTGWGVLGLRAWGDDPAGSAGRLASAFEAVAARGPGSVELAMLLLAEGPRSLELLGVARSSSPLPPGEGPGVRGAARPGAAGPGSIGALSTCHDLHPGPLPKGEGGGRHA